jgi:hypothetical protein
MWFGGGGEQGQIYGGEIGSNIPLPVLSIPISFETQIQSLVPSLSHTHSLPPLSLRLSLYVTKENLVLLTHLLSSLRRLVILAHPLFIQYPLALSSSISLSLSLSLPSSLPSSSPLNSGSYF